MTKQEARAYYLQKRISLSAEERQQKTLQIFHHFQNTIQIPSHSFILSYLPIEPKGEMQTEHINQYLKKKFQATIAFPKMETGDTFKAVMIKESTNFIRKRNSLFPEPEEGEVINPLKLNLVITPLIQFDRQGNRVGYGKGMYDQFLKKISSSCLVVGCSFFTPIERFSDVSTFDHALHIGICPDDVYSFVSKP